MAIGELATKVVVQYRADTSDIKAKLKELSGEERSLAQAQLANAEAHNKGIERQIKGFQQLSIGLELTKIAGLDLGAVFKNVTGLSGGFIAAGFAAGGAWGAAFGAAVEVGQKLGGVLEDIFDGGTKARIAESNAYIAKMRELDDLDKLESQITNELIRQRQAMDDLDPSIGGANRAFAEHAKRLGEAKDQLIAYAVALQKVREDRGTSTFIDRQEITLAREERDARTRLGVLTGGYAPAIAEVKIKAAQQRDALADVRKAHADGIITGKEYTDMLSGLGVKFRDTTAEAKKHREAMARLASQVAKDRTDVLVVQLEAELQAVRDQQSRDNVSGILPRGGRGGADPLVDSALAGFYGKGGGFESRIADNKSAGTESKLAQMFGPVDEISGYTMAFDTLSGAVGSAMTAWIDGSMSAGKAFKAFIAEAVKGIAVQMAMEALKHGAYAIGALAIGDAKGAALHGTSAAKFAAGAVAASIAAKALGGSGGSAGVGGGASGGGSPSGSGGQAQPGTQTIIAYGDSFAEDSPRQRLLRAGRIVSRVRGSSGIEYA